MLDPAQSLHTSYHSSHQNHPRTTSTPPILLHNQEIQQPIIPQSPPLPFHLPPNEGLYDVLPPPYTAKVEEDPRHIPPPVFETPIKSVLETNFSEDEDEVESK